MTGQVHVPRIVKQVYSTHQPPQQQQHATVSSWPIITPVHPPESNSRKPLRQLHTLSDETRHCFDGVE